MKKRGRKVGYRKPEPRKKNTITLPDFWWIWLNKQPYSQSQTIQRALEEYKVVVNTTDNESLHLTKEK